MPPRRSPQKTARKQPDLNRIAHQRFGYEKLHPGQEQAVRAVLDGHDALVVMPTGAGKSAIYQLAASLIPGPTLVISPLLALQRDQAQSIAAQDVGDAAVVNSSIGDSQREAAFEELAEGDLEFLFLAPEQFNNPETLERLKDARPSLCVIDEAHCVSAWGHDFRPDYLRLGGIIDALGHPQTLALTATAAPPVRSEILERLGLQNVVVIVEGFDRPNIDLVVLRFDDTTEKQDALIRQVMEAEYPGIIYAGTRKRTEEIVAALQAEGLAARFYHAGMSTADRQDVEAAFMQDGIPVLVATTAFGMGIDKPNVRFVFHADISGSLDSYYQEIGRAGRDGEPAQAILFYDPKDLNLRRFLAGGNQLNAAQIETVAAKVQAHPGPISLKALHEDVELSKPKLKATLNQLTKVGVAETLPDGSVSAGEATLAPGEAADLVMQEQERRQQFERSRLEMMRNYAEVRDCRRKYLLNYFGETLESPCGHCDNCRAGITATDPERQPFPVNSTVVHRSWGKGQVMRYEEDKVVVLFDRVGYKTIDVNVARLRGLLRRIES